MDLTMARCRSSHRPSQSKNTHGQARRLRLRPVRRHPHHHLHTPRLDRGACRCLLQLLPRAHQQRATGLQTPCAQPMAATLVETPRSHSLRTLPAGPEPPELFGGELFEWSGTVEAGGKIRLALTCLFSSTRTASLTLRGLNTLSFSRCHRALRAVEQLGKQTLIGARGETGGWQERRSCRQTSCLLSKGSGRSPLLRPAQTLAALRQQPASASLCASITKATWKHVRPAARRCSPPAFGRGRCCPVWCVSPASLRLPTPQPNPTQPRLRRSFAGADLEHVPKSPGILRVPLRRHQGAGSI